MDIHIYTKKKRNTDIQELKTNNKLKILLHTGRYENTVQKRMGEQRSPGIAWNYKFAK